MWTLEKTTEAKKQRELSVKGCQISPTAQAAVAGVATRGAIAISPLPPEVSGALGKFEAKSSQYAGVHRRDRLREPVEENESLKLFLEMICQPTPESHA